MSLVNQELFLNDSTGLWNFIQLKNLYKLVYQSNICAGDLKVKYNWRDGIAEPIFLPSIFFNQINERDFPRIPFRSVHWNFRWFLDENQREFDIPLVTYTQSLTFYIRGLYRRVSRRMWRRAILFSNSAIERTFAKMYIYMWDNSIVPIQEEETCTGIINLMWRLKYIDKELMNRVRALYPIKRSGIDKSPAHQPPSAFVTLNKARSRPLIISFRFPNYSRDSVSGL